jgi:hypothetical protein
MKKSFIQEGIVSNGIPMRIKTNKGTKWLKQKKERQRERLGPNYSNKSIFLKPIINLREENNERSAWTAAAISR